MKKPTPAQAFYGAMNSLEIAISEVLLAKEKAPEIMINCPAAQHVMDNIESAECELRNWLERREGYKDEC